MTGTSQYSRAEMSDQMAKLKMSGSLFNFQTTKQNLPAALNFVSHVLREASYPESEFKQAIERIIVNAEASRNEPSTLVSQALQAHFNPYPAQDIRAFENTDATIERLKALRLEEVKAFHSEFLVVSKGELSIIGDMDVSATKAAIANAFSNWESPSTLPAFGELTNYPFAGSPAVQYARQREWRVHGAYKFGDA